MPRASLSVLRTNVTVLCGDATHIDLPAERFSAVVCLSMLHHVPTPALQDQVLHEVFRVLRPQGRFLAVDAVDTDLTRQLHIDDTFTPLNPATVTERLAAAGFSDIRIDRVEHRIRLSASNSIPDYLLDQPQRSPGLVR